MGIIIFYAMIGAALPIAVSLLFRKQVDSFFKFILDKITR